LYLRAHAPAKPALASPEIDTLHMVADDLRAFPDRRNTVAAEVADDLWRLAVAPEAGGGRTADYQLVARRGRTRRRGRRAL
jgi:hypothetical protein